MNQQQNQQPQNNELQKKAEVALSASFVMPPIRTMADDLMEASKGVTVPVVAAVPVIAPKVVPQPASSVVSSSGQTVVSQKPYAARPGAPLASTSPQKAPAGNTVAMPTPLQETNKKSFVVSMLLGVGVALVLSIVVFSGYIFWPKKTNTIADKIPAEAVAFANIKSGSGALEKALLPKILTSMGLSNNSIGTKWSDLVYVVIPGSTSSESVSFLMTDDAGSVNLEGNSGLVLKKLTNGNSAIVDTKETGRLDGLGGKSLGDNGDYRSLSAKLSPSSEYLYLGPGESAAVLSAFSLLTKEQSAAHLFAVSPSTDGGKYLPVTVANSINEKFVKNQITWETPIKAIPASTIAITGHGSLSADVDLWRLSQSNNSQMQPFLNVLNTQGAAIEALKANLETNYLVASLANDTPIPDGIAVLRIKDGTTALVTAQMTNLEEALRLLGPLVGGAPYSDVVFEDGNYRDVAIRYVNFGDARRSLDYAIVDSLLFVSTSKISMEQMIDAYKGDVPNFTTAFAAQSTGQTEWQYVRMDEKVLGRLPASLKTMLSGITSTYFEPIKTGVYTGNIAY